MTKSTSSTQAPWRSASLSITPLLRLPGPIYLFLLTYSIVLAFLLDYQSLWLDEIMQLLGTSSGTLDHLEQLTRAGLGGAPLGWLPQLYAIHLFGYSVAVARLPSAIGSVCCCLTVFVTARTLGQRYPFVPAILLSVVPLHFRYALEGRPYSQALLLSALATLLFVKLIKSQSYSMFVAYVFILVLGIYSQPFTCFTAFAHFVWALTAGRRQRLLVYFSGSAAILMLLTFLPWYLYASPLWGQAAQSGRLHLHLDWKTPLMLIREISGAGYLGGVILLLLAAVGFYKGRTNVAMRWLLVACSIVPGVCVLVVDGAFGYFLAIRQMIFILPPLVLLASDGVCVLVHSAKRSVAVVTALLTIGFVGADVSWLRKPREDWKLAARTVEQQRNEYSACTLYAPPDSLEYYKFFEPQLKDGVCPSSSIAGRSVILAISPYATEADRTSIDQLLKGKHLAGNRIVGMSTVQVFR